MNLKIWQPLLIALVIYWLLIFVLLGASYIQTPGHFGYPLDDTYIHMAIGKHFVNDGFWGVSQTGFSSSTSSPLWTLLIVLIYGLFGINDWAPFVLGAIGGSCVIILCYFLLRKHSNPLTLSMFLLFIVLLTPLPIMALTGMEHILHGFLTLLLMYSAATFLSKKEFNWYQLALLLLLSALVTTIRYEGLFLIFTISLLFVIAKRFSLAFLVGVAGLLLITVYGFLSISQGWYFFPNSILLKGNFPVFSLGGIIGFLRHLPVNLLGAPHILILVIACLIVYLWGEDRRIVGKRERYLTAIFVMITLLHMQFASIGWFFRYEAYLILAGSVVLVDMGSSLIRSYAPRTDKPLIGNFVATVVLVVLVVLPMAFRAGSAFRGYPLAVMNIYEQQYQMGLFLKTYYEGKYVAANDIGAINYLADVKVLDLHGLGSVDILQAKRNGLSLKNTIADLTQSHNVEIVIIYNSWFEGNIPPEWIEIGRWQIANNVVSASDTVSFYVPTAWRQAEAIANLKNFSDELPSTVSESGVYVLSQ